MALIKCPECGKEISDKARSCPHCGNPIRRNGMADSDASFHSMSTSEKSKKFYEKGWFCILMLILFFPVGLFLMWKYKIFSQTVRTIITVFIAIAFVGNVLLNSIADSGNQEAETTTQNTEKSNKVTTESQKETDNSENGQVNTVPIDFEKELEVFSSNEYLYITNSDLNTYSVNMEGVKVYVVTQIDDIKADMIQSTLSDGYMMSSFHVGDSDKYQKYESSLNKDDLVAILGTVSKTNDFGVMGSSVELNDCLVFAKGEETKKYQKETSDEALSEYLVVTDKVADSNSEVSKDDYKALCETLDYESVLRNPDENKGKYCVLSGTVDQIIEGLLGTYTIYIADSSGEKWKCVYTYGENETHLLEGDVVTVFGKCKGTATSTTVLGKQMTMPYIDVEYIN